MRCGDRMACQYRVAVVAAFDRATPSERETKAGERSEMLGLIDDRCPRFAVHLLQTDDVGRRRADHFGDFRNVIGTAARGLALDVVGHHPDGEHAGAFCYMLSVVSPSASRPRPTLYTLRPFLRRGRHRGT